MSWTILIGVALQVLEVILEGRGGQWLVDGLSRDKTNNSKGIEMKNS